MSLAGWQERDPIGFWEVCSLMLRHGWLWACLWPDKIFTKRENTRTHTTTTGGWSTSVNHTRYGYTLVNAFTGAGGQAFVGLGAAVFIRTYSYSQRLSNWNTNPNTYTVAGMGTRKTRGQNIFISKKGFTVRSMYPPRRYISRAHVT